MNNNIETIDLYCPTESSFEDFNRIVVEHVRKEIDKRSPRFRIYSFTLSKEAWKKYRETLQDNFKRSFKVIAAPVRKECGYSLYGVEFIRLEHLAYAITKTTREDEKIVVKYHCTSLGKLRNLLQKKGWKACIAGNVFPKFLGVLKPDSQIRLCIYKNKAFSSAGPTYDICCWGFDGLTKVLTELGYGL